MSETPTGTDRVELTEAEYDQLSDALKLEPPTPGAPMYYVGGIDDVVASIVAARVQALTAERDGAQRRADEGWRLAREREGQRDAARAELDAANAKISKWAEDYKKLAHECGGTELDRQALAARCAELERMTVNVPADIASENADLQATLDRVTALADECEKVPPANAEMNAWQRAHAAFARSLRAALTPEGKP